MPFYLLRAGGVQNVNYAWSVNAVCNSSQTEGQVSANWDAGWTQLWTSLGTLVSNQTQLTFTSASTASSTFRQTTKTRVTRANAGAQTGGALPMTTCPVVTWRAAAATKWGRGRWYLPAVASAALAANGFVLLPASVTTIVAGVNNLLTQMRGTTPLVILHRRATLHGPPAYSTDFIVAGDVSNLLHVQKRRQSKVTPTRTAVTV